MSSDRAARIGPKVTPPGTLWFRHNPGNPDTLPAMKMTKITVAALTLVLATAACGDDDTGTAPSAADTTTSTAAETTTTTGTTTSSTATTAGDDEPDVIIEGFAFPKAGPVEVGDEVLVVNRDGAPHTWTSTDGLFDSGTLRNGDTFVYTFTEAGEYDFFCGIHPSMTGTITVTG